MQNRSSDLAISKKKKKRKSSRVLKKCTFCTSMRETDLVQFIGHGADDGLVSEVEMEPLKIHLPVNSLITMCLRGREVHYNTLFFIPLVKNKSDAHL